jgi:hypothetical protein
MSSNILKLSGGLRVGSFASDPVNPENGLIYYNSTTNSFKQYSDGAWADLGSGKVQISATDTSPSYLADKLYIDNGANATNPLELETINPGGAEYFVVRFDQAKIDHGSIAGLGDDDHTIYIKADGTRTFTGPQSLGGFKLTSVADPTLAQDAATKNYVDTAVGAIVSGADTALSNLTSPTAINQHLLPDLTGTRNLGSMLSTWQYGYIDVLKDVNDTFALDTLSRKLYDQTGQYVAVDAGLRQLVNETGLTKLLWTGTGPMQISNGGLQMTATGGSLDMGGFKIENVLDPSVGQDAATKNYVDTSVSNLGSVYIKIDGTTPFSGDQSMNVNKITDLANGTAAGDAVNKSQLDAKIDSSEKGAANGVAPLNGASKIDAAYLPSSLMEFQGSWDPTTNLPALADGAGDIGDVYRASAAGVATGSWSDPSMAIAFAVGDFVMYNGTVWQRSPAADGVTSVNGLQGIVTLDTDDINEGVTNLYFTDERAQDAVGSILTDSATIDFTYDDGAGTITAIVIDSSITDAKIASGIDAAKLADGSVSNVELQYINSLTSNAQTQLDAKMEQLSDDAAPALGGDLALGTYSLKGKMHLSEAAVAANFVETEYIHSISLAASSTAVASELTFAHASFEGCEIKYKIKEATTSEVRIGRLRVVTNGTDISLVDDYTESADVGVSWSAAVNGANIEISYTTTANNKTMRAEITRIKA